MPRNTNLTKFGESRLLGEYLALVYPDAAVYPRMRLGPLTTLMDAATLDASERALLGSFRRWADAVVVRSTELIVCEAKVRSMPGAIAQLLLYDELVPLTRELAPYLGLRRVLELVVAVEDPAVRRLAERNGIRHVVYRPAWLPEYLAQLHRREARAPRDFGTVR